MKNVSPHEISGAPLSLEATTTSTPGNVSTTFCAIERGVGSGLSGVMSGVCGPVFYGDGPVCCKRIRNAPFGGSEWTNQGAGALALSVLRLPHVCAYTSKSPDLNSLP